MTADETSKSTLPDPGPAGSGLRSLSSEDKGRIGQLIKVLAQERRDKDTFRQELDHERAKLKELQRERDSGQQQERALVARVSSALHLLRKYQHELYSLHNKDRAGHKEKGASTALAQNLAAPPSSGTATAEVRGCSPPPQVPTPPQLHRGSSFNLHECFSPSAAPARSREDASRAEPTPSAKVACSTSNVSPPSSPASSSASERPRLRSPSPAVLANASAQEAPQVDVPVLTPTSSHSSSMRHSRFTTLGVLELPQLKLLQRYLHIQQGGDGGAAERAVAAASAVTLEETGDIAAADGAIRGFRPVGLQPQDPSLLVVTPITPPATPILAAPRQSPVAEAGWKPAAPTPGALPVPSLSPPALRSEDPQRAFAPLKGPPPQRGTLLDKGSLLVGMPVTPPVTTAAANAVHSSAAPMPGALPIPSLSPPALRSEDRQHVFARLSRHPLHQLPPREATEEEAVQTGAHHPFRQVSASMSGGACRSSRSSLRSSMASSGVARPPRGRSSSPRRPTDRAPRLSPSTPSRPTDLSPRPALLTPTASPQHISGVSNLRVRVPTSPPRSRPRSPPVTKSQEALLQSPSLPLRSPVQHRGSRGSSLGTVRSSWATCIDDGYYGAAMFDVLDSVESAISHGSSFDSSAAGSTSNARSRWTALGRKRYSAKDTVATLHRGAHRTDDLRRLQQELEELEHRVYGSGAPDAASSTEATLLGASRDSFRPCTFSQELPLPPSPSPPLRQNGLFEGNGPPIDVAPSTPPRKSREFDVCGGVREAPRPTTPVAAAPVWASMPPLPTKPSSTKFAAKLDEIDDVLHLLHRAPMAKSAEHC